MAVLGSEPASKSHGSTFLFDTLPPPCYLPAPWRLESSALGATIGGRGALCRERAGGFGKGWRESVAVGFSGRGCGGRWTARSGGTGRRPFVAGRSGGAGGAAQPAMGAMGAHFPLPPSDFPAWEAYLGAPPFRSPVPPFRWPVPPFRWPVPPFRWPAPPFRSSAPPFHSPAPPFHFPAPPYPDSTRDFSKKRPVFLSFPS